MFSVDGRTVGKVWLSVSEYPQLSTAYPDVEGCYIFGGDAEYYSNNLPAYVKEVAVGSTAIAVASQVIQPEAYAPTRVSRCCCRKNMQ